MVKAGAGRGLPMQRLDLLKPARSVLNRAASRRPAASVAAPHRPTAPCSKGLAAAANRGLAHTVGARPVRGFFTGNAPLWEVTFRIMYFLRKDVTAGRHVEAEVRVRCRAADAP